MIGNECCPPCPSVSVNVPGAPGTDGTPGADGANAYTITTANFTLPNVGSNVVVSVLSSAARAIGEDLFISDGTHFAHVLVVSVPDAVTINVQFLGESNDSAPGAVMATGAKVTPTGVPFSIPVTIAEGGTGATTMTNAQTALGLGQDPSIATSTGLSQTITNGLLEVGTCDINPTFPSGAWMVLFAHATVTMTGVTFASSRTITLQITNVGNSAVVCSATFATGILTTTTLPAIQYHVPFKLFGPCTTELQLQIKIDTVNSAGTLNVTAGSIMAIPLRYAICPD